MAKNDYCNGCDKDDIDTRVPVELTCCGLILCSLCYLQKWILNGKRCWKETCIRAVWSLSAQWFTSKRTKFNIKSFSHYNFWWLWKKWTVLEMLEWTRSGPTWTTSGPGWTSSGPGWTTSGPTSKFFFEIWPQVNVPKIQDLFIIKDSVEIFFKF